MLTDLVPDFGSQITVAAVIVWLLQRLKASKLPWVTDVSDRLNRWIAALGAAAATAGLGVTYNADAAQLIVNGFTFANLAAFAGAGFQQFVLQELIYRGAVKSKK